ncbi:MAG: 6-hydroxymethylpterin diphosphokinase MptE-like protein [Candidatus Thorarchaeota archaeon]
MEWTNWKTTYFNIVQRLELDVVRDREATKLLTAMLENVDPGPLLEQLRETITGRTVIICGAGPSLDRHLKDLKAHRNLSKAVIFAADGAVSVVLENDIKCDVVATDLDGNLEHLKEVSERGAILIVHSHGDNMATVKSVVPELERVLGSTQVEPTHRVFLWGGFTDGDRACHIASEYSPRKIILAGMDFGNLVGKWSKPGHETHYVADKRKRMKLEIAEELIYRLLKRTGIEYEFLT